MRHRLEVEGFLESIRDSLALFELLPLFNPVHCAQIRPMTLSESPGGIYWQIEGWSPVPTLMSKHVTRSALSPSLISKLGFRSPRPLPCEGSGHRHR